jgi:hypothetical protein
MTETTEEEDKEYEKECREWRRRRWEFLPWLVVSSLKDRARLPSESYFWLYGFNIPKLCRELPHLVQPDWSVFGPPSIYMDTGKHEFDPEVVRANQFLDAYKFMHETSDDDEDEEWTEERVEKIYNRTMEKIRTNPVFAEIFEEMYKAMKKAIDEEKE